MTGDVVVFAPSPQLTVTVEDLDGQPDIHLHAGGQGVWQSRMIASLGVDVVLCAALGGETGHVLRHLVGVELRARDVSARNGAYVHDRRLGGRQEVVQMPADPLSRHELDDLYELTLVEALRAGLAVLSGPGDEGVVPDDLYERLTADLRENGCTVVVDLAGGRLTAALSGGVDVVKVSHEELVDDGRAVSDELPDLVKACQEMGDQARGVVVSRAAEPALALIDGKLWFVDVPSLETVDTRGAGDSMTAGLAAGLAQGRSLEDALRLGAAAGALNVTRHGLGTGSGEAVRELAERVTLRRAEES